MTAFRITFGVGSTVGIVGLQVKAVDVVAGCTETGDIPPTIYTRTKRPTFNQCLLLARSTRDQRNYVPGAVFMYSPSIFSLLDIRRLTRNDFIFAQPGANLASEQYVYMYNHVSSVGASRHGSPQLEV